MATQQGMIAFDEEIGRKAEVLYATPKMVARRRRVMDLLQIVPGQQGLDLGPGPGFLACELAQRLGPTGRVFAVDNSPPLVAMTRQRAGRQGMADRVEAREGDAAALPLPDGALDFAAALQVYEYVPDVERALAEAYRVLRTGGRLALIDSDFDTLVLHTDDADLNTRVLRAFDEHFAHRTLPRRLLGLLRRAGFQVEDVELMPVLDRAYDPSTYSYSVLGVVAGFVRGRAGVGAADVDAWLADLERQHAAGTYFFSLNQYLFTAVKPTADGGI